jgi:aldose 1-epimerase
MRTRRILIVSAIALAALSCARQSGPAGSMHGVTEKTFGTLPDGRTVRLFVLANSAGTQVSVINYGGIIVALNVTDRSGKTGDIALGFDRMEDYLESSPYFGSIVGRYGNRIAEGRFSLDGSTYSLARNDGSNHLHGGLIGFDKVLWRAEAFSQSDSRGVALAYRSPDGEEGYPGTLDATVTYTLTDANELVFDYRATTNRATPVNLTQHTYFNLAGGGDILSHELMIKAARFTPVGAGLIPTGEIQEVRRTALDFTSPAAIGSRIEFDNANDGPPALAARVREPSTGRILEVYTTEPGLQFYSGNFLDGSLRGKGGAVYGHRSGFCLETQHFPDSPNQPDFPSTILRPGEIYESRTILRFLVDPS